VSSTAPDTRTKILDAALRIVETKGTGPLRMEDVATAAGVSRQAVYLHFGTRPQLFVALAAHVDETRGLDRHRKKVAAARTPLDALKAGIELQAAHFPSIHEIAGALEAARHSDEAARAAWDDRMTERRRAMKTGVEWLAREGLLDDAWTVEEATDMVWSLCSIKVWESLVIERGWSRARYVAHLYRVLAAGLLRR
jgi:AcrR family transcriptional regulator